jgi:branched-chain amino acid transport system substrate-binding protein
LFDEEYTLVSTSRETLHACQAQKAAEFGTLGLITAHCCCVRKRRGFFHSTEQRFRLRSFPEGKTDVPKRPSAWLKSCGMANIGTKIMKLNRILITGLLAVAMTCGCDKQSSTTTQSQGRVPIGVVAPLTGDGATYGQAMKRGFDLALGGEAGFLLIYEDTKMNPKDAISALNKLITVDKVQIVLGEAASGVTLVLAPVAEKNHVILFSSISSADKIKDAGDYIFRNVPRNEIQGKTAAEFISRKLSKMKVAVYGKNDEYGVNLSQSFKARLKELGGNIVFDDAYQPGQNDFRSPIQKIKESGAEAVFSPGNYQETAILLKQLKESGTTLAFVGGDGSYSPELITVAGDSAEGSYYTLMAADATAPYYKDFKNRFVAKYQKDPDVYDAYAFEAADIIGQAIKAVGNSSDKVKEYLYSHAFNSLTGELKFDKDGEVVRDYGIVKVVGGKFEEASVK